MLAYADDIAILIKGNMKLGQAINAIKTWTKEYKIEVNKEKSGIIICRKDKRTKLSPIKDFDGYPVVQSYKYLGVMIDDCLNFNIEKERKQEIREKQKKAIQLFKNPSLPRKVQHILN